MNYHVSGPRYHEVVVLQKGRKRFHGAYDGYGRVEGGDILELDYTAVDKGDTKLVLACFYEDERFEDLHPSWHDPGQGHFHDLESIEALHASNKVFASEEEFLEWWGKQ
jgi:hypothetical protein